jgi:plastocyanin
VPLLVVALASTALAADTGVIKGTVTASGKPLAGAVVMVEGPSRPAAASAAHAVMDQRDETFVPHVMAIPVGTTVDFPNSDPVLHNVSSHSPAKRFDLGMYEQGATRSVTFDVPGVVDIRCNVHPKMRAVVVVHVNPWVAVTDAGGGYTVSGVPTGRHDVRTWHESLAEQTGPVTVRAGEVVRHDVRLAPRR